VAHGSAWISAAAAVGHGHWALGAAERDQTVLTALMSFAAQRWRPPCRSRLGVLTNPEPGGLLRDLPRSWTIGPPPGVLARSPVRPEQGSAARGRPVRLRPATTPIHAPASPVTDAYNVPVDKLRRDVRKSGYRPPRWSSTSPVPAPATTHTHGTIYFALRAAVQTGTAFVVMDRTKSGSAVRHSATADPAFAILVGRKRSCSRPGWTRGRAGADVGTSCSCRRLRR